MRHCRWWADSTHIKNEMGHFTTTEYQWHSAVGQSVAEEPFLYQPTWLACVDRLCDRCLPELFQHQLSLHYHRFIGSCRNKVSVSNDHRSMHHRGHINCGQLHHQLDRLYVCFTCCMRVRECQYHIGRGYCALSLHPCLSRAVAAQGKLRQPQPFIGAASISISFWQCLPTSPMCLQDKVSR